MSEVKGYKLVPIKLTDAMREAAADADAWAFSEGQDQWTGDAPIWDALLAAAPTLPQPIYDEEKERELFEASATSALGRDSEGYYLATDTYLRWQGWKACAQGRAKAGAF